jgi:membrane-associated phospholipid phosphatase
MSPAPRRWGEWSTEHRSAAIVGVVAAALSVVLGLLVANHWAPLERLDTRTARHLNDYIAGRSAQAHAWRLVSDILAPAVLRAGLLVGAAVLLLRHDVRRALFCAATAAGSLAIVAVVKAIVGRPRPVMAHSVARAAGESFPSGHALTSAATAICLVGLVWARRSLRVPVAVAAAGLTFAVGFSRIILGVHYVSDVVGGWLMATALVAGLLVLVPPVPQRSR